MNNIRKIRAQQGMSGSDLAKKMGVSRAFISRAELDCIIGKKNIKKFSEILNVNPIYLLGADNFKILPKNEEEKQILIDIIKKL